MDEIERRHYAAVKDVTSRSYDYLNHRLIGFDQHLCEFEARLNDLKLYVGSYVEKVYNPVWESPQGMRFLQKFERIGTLVPLIAMENKHNRILTYLLEDFNRIVSILEVHGHCPPTPKNFSTVAGRCLCKRPLWYVVIGWIVCRSDHVVLYVAEMPGTASV